MRQPLDEPGNGSPQDLAGSFRYLARQPILDQRSKVHGYELLYRMGPEQAFRGDGDLATRSMIDNAVLFGLERLTGWLPAFVNCTMESLTGEFVHALPPSISVLELLEDLRPTPALIAACRSLKTMGFRLALDDFVWKPELEPLVDLADYIKVDFRKLDAAERKKLLGRLSGSTTCLIAEKVETQEDFAQARAEGFRLFQGYYFCRPVLLKNRRIPANRLSHIRILEALQQDPIDLRRLSELVKQEPSLTYRLLRLVNSPVCAIRQEVDSIEIALVVVGEDAFRRIALLAITSELNADQPTEILRMAFVRGRFCELASRLCALLPAEQFLVGLLSMFPAMLRISMEDLAPTLPLREEIRQALLGKVEREQCLLQWLESQERGDWGACDAIAETNALDSDQVMKCYLDSVVWAEGALNTAILAA
jgi:EAL and modified HD-GYP domain-containing signal transduction protein